jgi:hypothetical protein
MPSKPSNKTLEAAAAVMRAERAIEIGDVVQLKSGGHPMTVTDLEDRDGYPSATLMWSHDCTVAIMDFPIAALCPFDPENGMPF